MEFNSMHPECVTCMNDCKDRFVSEIVCPYRSEIPTDFQIGEINREIRNRKFKLKKFCKQGHLMGDRRIKLNYTLLKSMLDKETVFTYKYLKVLRDKLFKRDWTEDFVKQHPTGFNETNNFDTCYLIDKT